MYDPPACRYVYSLCIWYGGMAAKHLPQGLADTFPPSSWYCVSQGFSAWAELLVLFCFLSDTPICATALAPRTSRRSSWRFCRSFTSTWWWAWSLHWSAACGSWVCRDTLPKTCSAVLRSTGQVNYYIRILTTYFSEVDFMIKMPSWLQAGRCKIYRVSGKKITP